MALVLLLTSSSSPWTVPSDFTVAGHTVTLFGSGGNGAVGTSGASGTGGGGGGGGACTSIVYSSGTITPGTTTIPFLINAGGSANATQWQSSTAGSGAFYEALPGGNGAAAGTAGAASGATTTVGTPTITYTPTNHTGAAGGASGGSNSLGGGGGGGSGGPAANGGAGATPTLSGGGGGGGGGAANAGTNSGTATGGNGGNGSSGTGGTGTTGTGNPGTGSSGGGGGGGDAVTSIGGAGGSGRDVSADSNRQCGAGGGGGGAGGKTTTGAVTTLTGGNGGSFGGGGGGVGCQRTAGGTLTAGAGSPGAIAIVYRSTAWGFEPTLPSPITPFALSVRYQRAAAARSKSEFAFFPPWIRLGGFEPSLPNPTAPRQTKVRPQFAGATMRGDDGSEAPFIKFRPTDWPPPDKVVYAARPATRNKSALAMKTGFARPLPFPAFQETQAQTLKAPKVTARSGGVSARGDDGIAIPTPVYEALGFEETFSQEPRGWKLRSNAALFRGDDGTQGVAPIYETLGFEETYATDLRLTRQRSGALARWIDGTPLTVPSVIWADTTPHPMFKVRRERSGALARWLDGIDAILPIYETLGFEETFATERHPTALNRSAALFRGLDGIESPLPPSTPPFFESNLPTPLTPYALSWRFQRIAAALRGDDGIAVPTPVYETFGFDPTFAQDRHLPLLHRLAAILRGDDGIAATLPPPPVPWFEVAPPFLAHPRPERNGALARWIDGTPPFVLWQNVGFEQTLSQDRHRLFKSPETGDQGIVSPFVAFVPDGWTPTISQDRHRLLKSPEFGHQGIDSPFAAFVPDGWTPTTAQDPHVRRERSGALARGDDGIEPAFRVFQPWGETTPALVRKALFRAPEFGDAGIAAPFAPFTAIAWPEPPLYRQPPTWRAGAIMAGDPGAYVPSAIVLPFASWPEPPMHQRPTYWRGGATFRGDDGIAAILPPFVTVGTQWWDDRQPQEQLKVPPTRRFAGTVGGDPGTEAALISFFPYGWEVPSPQPPHPRPESRSAGLVGGDGGFEAPAVPFFPYGWETLPAGFSRRLRGLLPAVELIVPPPAIAPFVEQVATQQPRWIRRAPEFGDAGIASPFAPFTAFVEQVATQQPRWVRHSPEFGDPGIASPFVQFTALEWPSPPTHRQFPARRGGALARGADGIEFPIPALLPWFETTPPLARHAVFRSPEFGDPGIASPFVRFTALEWPAPPTQRSPTPRFLGAVVRGDDGNYVQSHLVLPVASWPEPPLYRNPSPRFAGAILRGDDGIENTFTPPITVATQWWDDRMETLRRPPRTMAALYQRLRFAVPSPNFLAFAFEPTQALTRHRVYRSPETGDQGIEATVPLVLPVTDWPAPPMHKRPPRMPSALAQRISFAVPSPVFPPLDWPWVAMHKHPRPERSGAVARGDEGTESTLPPPFVPFAETTPPLLPPLPRAPLRRLAGGLMRGDDGNYVPTVLILPLASWPEPPMHKRPTHWRAGAFMRGDEGNEAPFIPPVFTATQWWDDRQPQEQLRVPPTRRIGGLFGGDPGNAATLLHVFPEGWQVQPWQPPHPTPERRAAATLKGDEGILRPFTRFFPVGFEPSLPSPLSRPPLVFQRAAATMRGDEGILRPFTRFFTHGFEPTPPLFFRRPLPHVPVFVLQSVESYAPFVPNLVASASTVIVPYRAATTLGAMELKTIIEAFAAATVIKRRDT